MDDAGDLLHPSLKDSGIASSSRNTVDVEASGRNEQQIDGDPKQPRRQEHAGRLADQRTEDEECYSALLQLLATHSMKVRLARLLAMLATSGSGPSIRLTHGQLAGMIGSTRQWVSQTLALFEKQDLIQKKVDGSVYVLRPEPAAPRRCKTVETERLTQDRS